MLYRSSLGAMVLAAALYATIGGAQAFDDAKYPDWKGQWTRIGDARWDIGKPRLAQQAPLTPEYETKLEASIAEQRAGGHGNDLMYKCIPPGMPRMMLAYNPLQFLVFPEVTYIAIEHFGELRRVYTDDRPWPDNLKSTFAGYSIGKWVDENGDGRYDTLLIETRNIGGPRAFDSSGLPLHDDDQTIVKERIHLDRDNPEILRNEVTTIDHALTRPWTVTRSYQREHTPVWIEHACENNHHVVIGGENYFFSADGDLMPARKDQPPPDLRYFDQPQK